MAKSTQPAVDARVRTYIEICRAWEVQAFPITAESRRCFAGSLKAGHYRSAKLYFQTIFVYQVRNMGLEVDKVIRQLSRDYTRSITRGMGPSSLKDCFDIQLLTNITINEEDEYFDMDNVTHVRDWCAVSAWFMLRELEQASAKVCHLYPSEGCINLLLPMRKTAQEGQMTLRRLRCACRVQRQPLCPVHCALRHLHRVSTHPRDTSQATFPLVPTADGGVPTKHEMIQMVRKLISATGTELCRPDEQGQPRHRFSGHTMRVAGAQWLSRAGLKLNQIQLLVRWSSAAVQRYVQDAPLENLPDVSIEALTGISKNPIIYLDQTKDEVLDVEDDEKTVAALHPPQTHQLQEECSRAKEQVETLRTQLAALRNTIFEPEDIYIHRPKSHIVHKGAVDERKNHPLVWKTFCGWPYGQSKFYRLTSLSTMLRGCRKCFRDQDVPVDSESDHHSEGDDGSNSDSSSSS